MMKDYLSILKNAGEGSITYYVGDNPDHVKHLKNCKLYCQHGFDPGIESLELIHVDNPQLEFYKISRDYEEDYLGELEFNTKYNSYINKNAKISESAKIYPGCVIGDAVIEDDVVIRPNTTIYSKTKIGKGTIIDANSTIGAEGILWIWDDVEGRINLFSGGGVQIGKHCVISSDVTVVRGSNNEMTIIDDYSCIAHGAKIGHGSIVGKFTHLANNVTIGGSVEISDRTFFGSGSTAAPGCKIKAEILVGAGAVVRGDISKPGVYVGVPANWIKEISGKLSGVPKWKNKLK